MSIISLVMLVAFGSIYFTTATNLKHDIDDPTFRPFPVSIGNGIGYDNGTFRTYLIEQRSDDTDRILTRLLVTLLLVGALTLTAVYFVSRYVAERAIAPIKEAYEKQKQFIADASHELKTPLAAIDANLDAFLEGQKKPSKWIGHVQSETDRMTVLVNDLLTLAKLDSLDKKANLQSVDVREVVKDVAGSMKPLLDEKGVSLTGPNKKRVSITTNRDTLRQIITILMDNAAKYTSKDGKVILAIEQSVRSVEVKVTNTHPTLPQEKLDKLFDRFYQADSSHHNNGYGLGLAIAKRAAEQIGGHISVTSEHDTVTFTLSLPA